MNILNKCLLKLGKLCIRTSKVKNDNTLSEVNCVGYDIEYLQEEIENKENKATDVLFDYFNQFKINYLKSDYSLNIEDVELFIGKTNSFIFNLILKDGYNTKIYISLIATISNDFDVILKFHRIGSYNEREIHIENDSIHANQIIFMYIIEIICDELKRFIDKHESINFYESILDELLLVHTKLKNDVNFDKEMSILKSISTEFHIT